MTTLATLVVKLVGDISSFQKSMEDAQGKLESAGGAMKSVGAGLSVGVSAPILGIGTAATIASTQFNEGMANVASLGEEAAGKIAAWKPQIQEVAIATGKSTTDMASGMYQVVSAYGSGSEAVAQLGLNAKLAAAGLSTVSEAIGLTSAVTKGYGDTSLAAQQNVADLAMQTVAMGQTTFPDLAASMGRVVPIAASLGVTQQELFGVMATATGVTGQTAEVSTQLRGVLQSLMAPTGDMATLMKSMGYESGQAMLQSLGLQGTIDAVVKAANDGGVPLQKYIGSIEGQTLALALAGPQADTFRAKLDAMGSASGMLDKAFAAQTSGVNESGFAMEQAKIKVEVLLQRLGDGLAPAIIKVIDAATPLITKVTDLATRFAELDPKTQTIIVAIGAAVAAIGPLLVIIGTLLPALTALGAVIGVVGTVLGALLSPIGLVVIAIAALVAGVILLVTHWEEVKTKAAEVWEAVRSAVVTKVEEAKQKVADFVSGVKEFFTNFDLGAAARTLFSNVVTAITEKATDMLKAAVGWLDDALVKIENFDLKAAAKQAFETVVVGTGEKVADALTKVGDWLGDMFDKIKGFDLKGAATTAFQTVVVGTGEKVADALGKVGDWLNDTANKIKGFDLKGAAHQAFDTVVVGQAEKTGTALTNVGTWLTNTATKIQGHTFKSETLTAFATVVAGLLEKTGTALTEVGNFLTKAATAIREKSFKEVAMTAFHTIVTAIEEKARDILGKVGQFLTDIREKISNFSLKDVGIGLIQGLIDGIGSQGSALAGAMRSLIQSAIDHIKSIFGIKSPSTVMAEEVGKPLAQGIAQGIIDNAPATGTALDSSIATLLGNLRTAITQIVEEFKKLAELYATDSSLASAKAVSDPLKDLFDNLATVAEGVQAVSGLALEDIQKAEANAGPFVTALGTLVMRMNAAAELFAGDDWVGSVTTFSTGAEAAIKPIKDGADALVAIAENIGKLDGKWIGSQMQAFTDILGGLVQQMKRIGAMFTQEGWVESVEAYSKGAIAATAPVKGGVEALIAITEGIGKLDGKWIGSQMQAFTDILGGLVQQMKRVGAKFTQEGWVESVEDFSKGALAATSPVKGGIEALVMLQEGIKKLNGSTIGDDMKAFTGILGGLVENMRRVAVQFSEGGLAAVESFSKSASASATAIVAGSEAIVTKALPAAKDFANASATIGDSIMSGMELLLRPMGFAPGVPGVMTMLTDAVVGAMATIDSAWRELASSAFRFGSNWIGQLINGLNSRKLDLVALMEYIRGLFPSSPAKYGPWRDLPDGQRVGAQFAAGLAAGLDMRSISGALGGLRQAADGRQQAAGSRQQNVTVNIYNPVGQTAESDLLRQMRNLAVVGAI